MLEWQGHALLGLRAAQGLPSWEIGMLRPDMSPEETGKPFMPEIRSVTDKLGAYCLILDWIYQPEYARYCRQENGRWIPHGPAADDFTAQGAISMTANHILITKADECPDCGIACRKLGGGCPQGRGPRAFFAGAVHSRAFRGQYAV